MASSIGFEPMTLCLEGRVPVLTVHDSFIILAEHEKALRKQMEGQYKHLLNIDWETDIKTKTEY